MIGNMAAIRMLSIRRLAFHCTRKCTRSASQIKEETFEELLETSKFFGNCGETPVGQKVVAKIIAERGDNLYVDFGGKFHAVVPRPTKNGRLYRKGKWVNVVVEDLEITEHFQGESTDVSLLEAQVGLLGLSNSEPH